MLHPRLFGEDDIPLRNWIDCAEVIDVFYRLQDGQLSRYVQHEVCRAGRSMRSSMTR